MATGNRQNSRTEHCAAFFDLDRTLILANSAILYAKYERRNGRISRFQLFRAFCYLALYHLSLLDMERAYGRVIRPYRGVSADVVERYTRDWFLEEVEHRLLPGAKAAIEDHRQQGHPLVLLTNGSGWVADVAVETWGLEHGMVRVATKRWEEW